MAHGANAGLVGRRLEDIIGGIPRFDGVLNGTQLHLNFVAAAEEGGAWRAYSWINEGDTELYLKLAYLTKVQREGREYYIGVGLSDRPLSEVQGLSDVPCSPFFSDSCAEDWALSIAGYRMSTILQARSYAELEDTLRREGLLRSFPSHVTGRIALLRPAIQTFSHKSYRNLDISIT